MWAIALKKAWESPVVRGLVTVALGATAAWLLWGAFASHYREQGVAQCRNEQLAAVAKANEEQKKANEEQQNQSDELADGAVNAAETAVDRVDEQAAKTEEVITDVYRDPPATAPVVFDSCVHPVDDRVQNEIERSVKLAND